MKITVEIDCTPSDVREFIGLPDVKPIQDKWLAEIQKSIMTEAKNLSADQILKSWTAGASTNFDLLSKLAEGFMSVGGGKK